MNRGWRALISLIPGSVGVITAKTLSFLDRILDYAEPFLKDETVYLFLKGRRAGEEQIKAEKSGICGRKTSTVSAFFLGVP
jgi:16S rRNA G527 N7-methylase RsmG